jgi:hypothetical protein
MFARRTIDWMLGAVVLSFSLVPQPLCGTGLASTREAGPRAAPARAPAAGERPTKGPRLSRRPVDRLPDTVLVRIEGRRDIVRSFAARRWREQHDVASHESITPAAVRGFLDLLTDEAVLTEAAVREAAPLSPSDSAAHWALRDRLVLAAALDSALAEGEPKSGAGSIADPEARGTRARERVVARLEPKFDDSSIARLARAFAALPRPSADSGLSAQLHAIERLPILGPADSNAVLARSSVGEVRAGEVVTAWARLSVAYRRHIDTPEQVKDLVANQLFERALRAAAAGGRFQHDPRIVTVLTANAEQVRRRGYIERHVLDGITPDSAAVAAYWKAHAADWALPRRVRGIRLAFDDRQAAVRMRLMLADSVAAETLAVRAARGGLEYRFVASERGDSVLFRRALEAGPGSVLGPVSEDGGWWVARVTAILPARHRSWAESRVEAEQRWFAEEAERRTRALASRLRAGMRIETSPEAVERWIEAVGGGAAIHSGP